MKRKNSVARLVFFTLNLAFLLSWIYWVSPYPDRDSVSQFYYPMFSTLDWFSTFGWDHEFVRSYFLLKDYPDGLLLLASLIYGFGLGDLVLEFPYVLQLILLIPLMHSCYLLSRGAPGRRFWIASGLALNPFTLYCLRSFSLQSYNVVFAIAAIVLFECYIKSERKRDYAFFLLYATIAASMKHLGLLILLAYLGSNLTQRNSGTFKRALIYIVALLPSLYFYNWTGFVRYFAHTKTHNPGLDWKLWILVLTFSGLVLLLLRTKSLRESVLLRFQIPVSVFLTGLTLLIPAIGVDPAWSDPALVLGLLAFLFILFDLNPGELNGKSVLKNLYIFSLLYFCLAWVFYFALFGRVFFIFFPSLIIFCALIGARRKRTVLIALFLMGNFFPGVSLMESLFSQAGRNWVLNAMNCLHLNLWSWESSQLSQSKETLNDWLSSLDFSEERMLMLTGNLHPHLIKCFEMPPNYLSLAPSLYRLDQLPSDELESFLQQVSSQELEDLIQQGKLPLIIRSVKGSPFAQELYMQETMDDLLSNTPKEEIGLALSNWLVRQMDREDLLQYYSLLSSQEGQWEIYGLKELPKRKFSDNKASDALLRSKKIERDSFYNIKENNRPVPSSELKSESDMETQENRKVRAGELFLESNQYFETNPAKCIELLKKVLELDPNHEGASEDLKVLQSSSG